MVSLLWHAPVARSPGAAVGLRIALRSLSSATLAVGSAATFLVLVTGLSFVPDGGAASRPTSDEAVAWQLRGGLQAANGESLHPQFIAPPAAAPTQWTASRPTPAPFAAVASRS